MKLFHHHKLLLILLFVVGFSSNAQQNKLDLVEFTAIPIANKNNKQLHKSFKKHSLFSLNTKEIKEYAQSFKNDEIVFNLTFPGIENFKMTLRENDILTEDYKVIAATKKGKEILTERKRIAFQGEITNQFNSSISLTITNNIIYGIIKTNAKEYFIEPLKYITRGESDDLFVLYETKDILQHPNATCGVTEVNKKTKDIIQNKLQKPDDAGDCYIVRVAIASDESAVAQIGGGSIAAMEAYNIALMNTVAPYFKDFEFPTNVELKLAGQYISNSAVTEPYSQDCSSCTIDDQLDYFREWAINGGFGAITYDIAHNITDHFPPPGTVGLAYVGVLGNQSFNYGVTTITSYGFAWLTFIHELGHNFGMSHSFEDGQGTTGGFMDYGDGKFNGAYSWHPFYREAEFEAEVNYAANQPLSSFHVPILPCSSIGMPIADFSTTNDVLCVNSSIQLTNSSYGGATSYSWSFSGGTPATSTEVHPSVSFNTTGEKTISLTATNENGSNTILINKFIVDEVLAASCSFSSTTANTNEGGSIFFQLNTISKNSGGAFTDGNHYVDYSCSDNTILDLNTTYIVNTESLYSNPTQNQLFIDYNNDGDFNDADETVYNGTSDSFSFTTPGSVIENKLLRARLIVKLYNSSLDPCFMPTDGFGQVEDYSVYFLNTSTLGVADNLEASFSIYPNPINEGNLTVFMPTATEDTKLTICNALGQLVHTEKLKPITRNRINLSKSLAKGLYYIKILQNDRVGTKKIIIQ